jgi:putative inorganic carbon (hco3(-)) transporter
MTPPSEHRQAEHQGPPGILFYCFAALLLYTILFVGMPVAQARLAERRYRDIFLVVAGVLGTAAGLIWGKISKARPESTRPGDRLVIRMAALLPAWALLQWVPLPLWLVAIISPARAELARGLEPLFGKQSFSSLSVSPALTLTHFLLLSAYSVMLFAAREFAVRSRRRIWVVASPIFLAAALEASLAMLQFSAGAGAIKGTFAIRNHLAGFLEMALPLALAFGISSIANLRDHAEGGRFRGLQAWLLAGGGLALAVLTFVAGLSTLSRGGFIGILGSLLVVVAFSIGRGVPLRTRLLAMGALSMAVLGLLFYLTPAGLLERLAQRDSESRTALWSEGIHVVREYPLAGAGLGGFESAFLKFKVKEGPFVVDYAHNDYLQGLAELGLVGFAMMTLLIGSVVMRSARMALGVLPGAIPASPALNSPEGMPLGSATTRWAALGCLGALTAILIHSVVDFNLYVPANAATLAWICGMAAGLTPSQRRRRQIVEVAENLTQRSSARR